MHHDSAVGMRTAGSAASVVWPAICRFARRHEINGNVLYVLPALGVYLLFVAWPVISVVRDSFYDWDGIRPRRTFIGLGNYAELLADPIFLRSIWNNLVWGIASIAALLVLGFSMAYLLNGKLRARDAYRAALFLPVTVSGVVVAIAWGFIYHPEIGLLNSALRTVGLGKLAAVWLGDPRLALYSAIAVNVWHYTGAWVVIYLAGLQTIPNELMEAASIDGANAWQRMWRIAIPLVKPTTAALLILGAIGAVRTFEIVYILTQGGPYHASEVMALRVYNLAFMLHRAGYASALSVVLLVIAAVITVLQLRLYRGAHQGA
ncbi:MAG: sugar ABC transporter permease [Chloroflexi bacterium]|nr:sugar ABC transporter permease [Chloroflexota bacterium]